MNKQAVSLGELWRIQESLLQAYRSIFITLESVLLAICALILSASYVNYFIAIVVSLLAIGLIYIWREVCHARANAVAFIHWLIQKHESEKEITLPYQAFREFQTSQSFQGVDVLNDPKYKQLGRSKTRLRMDTQLPRAFLALWVFIIIYSLVGLTS
jgi:hypothetical protein